MSPLLLSPSLCCCGVAGLQSFPRQLRLLTADQTKPPAGAGREDWRGLKAGKERRSGWVGRFGQFGSETASSGTASDPHMMTL